MEKQLEEPPLNKLEQRPWNQSDQPPLNHLEEYKVTQEEIAMYQREMHRTWLWAIIPAGAVYTWLSLHRSELSGIPGLVWFIPAGFVFICAGRYWVFRSRITGLVAYRLKLEKAAFGNEEEEDLRGMGQFIAKFYEKEDCVAGTLHRRTLSINAILPA